MSARQQPARVAEGRSFPNPLYGRDSCNFHPEKIPDGIPVSLPGAQLRQGVYCTLWTYDVNFYEEVWDELLDG